LIADNESYGLFATDVKGRVWSGKYILPSTSGCAAEEGVTVSGRLDQLVHTSKIQPPPVHPYSSFDMKFFQTFAIPCNVATQSSTVIGGKVRGQRTSLDVAQFKSCECDFEMRAENEMVSFQTFTHSNKLPPNLDLRAIEALQFVLAIPVEWVILDKCEGDTETIQIRRADIYPRKSQLGPPVDFKDIRNSIFVWMLYDKYLGYILKYERPDKYSPLSVHVRRVIKGSEGSTEARMLTLGIAVEGALRVAFPELVELPKEELNGLEEADEIVDRSSLNEELKRRIKGAIGSWKHRGAADMLSKLVNSGVIELKEFNAWKEIRHPSVHATLLNLHDLQRFVDLCHIGTVLFYKLIFHAIGYKGKYTDYSTHGWPLKEYS